MADALDQCELRGILDFAVDSACSAGAFTLGYFNAGTSYELKADNTPVTAADRGAEERLRRRIEQAFPTHGIVGEEFGESTYSYTVPVPASEAQSFYDQKMEELGWTSSFSLPVSEVGGILFFEKDEDFVTITITPDQTDSNSVDVILQK